MNYGAEPVKIGVFDVLVEEMMLYQYMPIKMYKSKDIVIDKRLGVFGDMIGAACCDFIGLRGLDEFIHSYVYITAKRSYVSPGCPINRPGWHTDGFGSDDINYIWMDANPTEVSTGPFSCISHHHGLSMKQFEQQARVTGVLDINTLYRLDRWVVHRVAEIPAGGFRTFLKLSFSPDQYNLKGNTINHDIEYSWDMKDRDTERNHPCKQ